MPCLPPRNKQLWIHQFANLPFWQCFEAYQAAWIGEDFEVLAHGTNQMNTTTDAGYVTHEEKPEVSPQPGITQATA